MTQSSSLSDESCCRVSVSHCRRQSTTQWNYLVLPLASKQSLNAAAVISVTVGVLATKLSATSCATRWALCVVCSSTKLLWRLSDRNWIGGATILCPYCPARRHAAPSPPQSGPPKWHVSFSAFVYAIINDVTSRRSSTWRQSSAVADWLENGGWRNLISVFLCTCSAPPGDRTPLTELGGDQGRGVVTICLPSAAPPARPGPSVRTRIVY